MQRQGVFWCSIKIYDFANRAHAKLQSETSRMFDEGEFDEVTAGALSKSMILLIEPMQNFKAKRVEYSTKESLMKLLLVFNRAHIKLQSDSYVMKFLALTHG